MRALFRLASPRFGWIRHAPMRRHRLTGPHRARFAGGIVANRENKIERRRARARKLVPGFRSKAGRVVAEAVQKPQRFRMHTALRLAAGAVGAKSSCASLFKIASAMIERAELPVQRNSALNVRRPSPPSRSRTTACGSRRARTSGAQHDFSWATRARVLPRAVAIIDAFTGRVERFPRDTGRIVDPGLFGLGIAAGCPTLLDDVAARLAEP